MIKLTADKVHAYRSFILVMRLNTREINNFDYKYILTSYLFKISSFLIFFNLFMPAEGRNVVFNRRNKLELVFSLFYTSYTYQRIFRRHWYPLDPLTGSYLFGDLFTPTFIGIYHINFSVIQGFPALRKAVTAHAKNCCTFSRALI